MSAVARKLTPNERVVLLQEHLPFGVAELGQAGR